MATGTVAPQCLERCYTKPTLYDIHNVLRIWFHMQGCKLTSAYTETCVKSQWQILLAQQNSCDLATVVSGTSLKGHL